VKGCTIAALLILCLSVLGGCKKDIKNTDAVRVGVMNYLSKRSDLLAMDVSVTSVAFHQDQATASVHFQAKGTAAAGSGMTMEYVLERKGTEWVVKGRAGSGSASPHAGVPQDPGGSAGSGSIGAMPQTLPPGHPAVSPDKGK
jgi:Ca2+-dependent lipid-binding protein